MDRKDYYGKHRAEDLKNVGQRILLTDKYPLLTWKAETSEACFLSYFFIFSPVEKMSNLCPLKKWNKKEQFA